MEQQNLPTKQSATQTQLLLKAQIQTLKEELNLVEQDTRAFEAKLRAILIDRIIEEQELSELYRQMQKAKKQKRLEQKKRGKHYKEPKGLKIISKQKIQTAESAEIAKEKKQLYREAMLRVHPDKYSLNGASMELATELTSKLIEIYKTGSLRELQLFHAQLFSKSELIQSENIHNPIALSSINNTCLKQEKEELEQKLEQAKNRPTYKVLQSYENPMVFAEELKAYYDDRLFKLRKRTRKARA